MNIDLTQQIKEPNGSPIPLEDQPRTTLGGLIYLVLTKVQAKSTTEAEHFIGLAEDIVGKSEYDFKTQDQARIQEMIQGLPNSMLRVYGARMLESQGVEANPTEAST